MLWINSESVIYMISFATEQVNFLVLHITWVSNIQKTLGICLFLLSWNLKLLFFHNHIFSILSEGDVLGQFGVSEVDGKWKVFSKKPLNREETEKYLLRVMVSDGKFQAATEVEILVLDVNDNSPECKQVIEDVCKRLHSEIIQTCMRRLYIDMVPELTWTTHNYGAIIWIITRLHESSISCSFWRSHELLLPWNNIMLDSIRVAGRSPSVTLQSYWLTNRYIVHVAEC